MSYIHDDLRQQINKYKENKEYEKAIQLVNELLSVDPSNSELLLEISDIQYRSGDMDSASKPIDYLLSHGDKSQDPMLLYSKGIIEIDKTNRQEAKKYLLKAVELTKMENPEVLRAYAMSEYRYGNREKGTNILEQARDMSKLDAEIVYNLTQIYMLQHRYSSASKMIKYYNNKKNKLVTIDKGLDYYDNKIKIFDEFLQSKQNH